jgi:hypothetical protein
LGYAGRDIIDTEWGPKKIAQVVEHLHKETNYEVQEKTNDGF